MSRRKESNSGAESAALPVRIELGLGTGTPAVATERLFLLVLGMHRSGTSALTRVLNLCGVDLPENILGAYEHNERGFWEPIKLVELHNEMLVALDSRWDDLGELPVAQMLNGGGEQVTALVDMLRTEIGSKRRVVIKDPRICRLMPLWRRAMSEFGAEAACVHVVRNPLEVAASLEKRDEFPTAKSLILWLRHFLDAERETRNLPRSFVSYDGLLENWRAVIRRIERDLAISLGPITTEVEQQVQEFLAPSLRHHRHTPREWEDSDVSRWVRQAYAWAERAVAGGPVEGAELDQIATEFGQAASLFVPVMRWQEKNLTVAKDATAAETARLEQSLAKAREAAAAEVAQLQQALAAAREASAAETAREQQTRAAAEEAAKMLEQELTRLAGELNARAAQIQETTAQAESHKSAADVATAEAARLHAELAAAAALHVTESSRLTQELAAMQSASETQIQKLTGDLEAQTQARSQESAQAAKQLAERAQAIAALQAELTQVTSAHQQAAQSAAAHEAEGARLASLLKDERSEGRRLSAHLAEQAIEVVGLREQLAGLATAGQNLQVELIERQTHIAELIAHRQSLAEKVEQGSGEARRLTDELTARQREAAVIAEQLAHTEQSRQLLMNQIAFHEKESGRLRYESDRWTDKMHDTERRLGSERETAAQLRGELASRDSELAVLNSRVRQIQSSITWKLGAPARVGIRQAKALLRGRLRPALKDDPTGDRMVQAARQTAASGLFDGPFYLARNPDVAAAGMDPLVHYLLHGSAEGRDPHPLFINSYYRKNNPDVVATRVDPLLHYVEHGFKECRDPNPLFMSAWYLEQNPDVAAAGVDCLSHYWKHGAAEGRDPHPLFHSAFYLKKYPDVAAANMNPLHHYLHVGAYEGRMPNRLFDSAYYLKRYPDIAAAGMNPLHHYSVSGWSEGRRPHPLFDGAYYLKRYPDVASAGVNPLMHYLRSGAVEGRNPNPWFDARWYLDRYPDIAIAGVDPLEHYLCRGAAEDRDAGPTFQTDYYLEQHPELIPAGVNPLMHWMESVASGYVKERYWRRPGPLRCDLRVGGSEDGDEAAPLKYKPLISILMPTFNTPPRYLRLAIESVKAQTYPNWELCICDDASTQDATRAVLQEYAGDQIRITYRQTNGNISRATNDALAMARGDFIAMLDHDDEMLPDALMEVVKALDADPSLDVVYTDQAYLSADGEPQEPILKPDWSPNLFRGVMYGGHLLVVRRELAQTINGFDPAFDKVQDYDFLLRLSERTGKIAHVPKILYYWRRIPGSVAQTGDAKTGIPALQAAAVNAHLKRMNIPAVAKTNPVHAHRVVLHPLGNAAKPPVSIFVRPTGDAAALRRCLDSILAQTRYPNFETFVVGSVAERAKTIKIDPLLDSAADSDRLPGDVWVSIRGDVEIVSPNWLEQLVFAAGLPGAGYVCPLILQPPGGTVDEAGLVLGLNGGVAPAMRGWLAEADGHAGSLTCLREVSAVSDGCVAASRAVALQRAQDEQAFESGWYRMAHRSAKLRKNLFTPRAILRRTVWPAAGEAEKVDALLFADLWHRAISGPVPDPFHNPNFSRRGGGFS